MKIYLLDMGRPIYGDCILLTHNSRRILIDGAHPGDRASILAQLKGILHQERPFSIDLLIVTHCHQDHIGCLPALVGAGDLSIKSALVADEKLGWGVSDTDGRPSDNLGLTDSQKAIIAGIREEDHSFLPQPEIDLFLADALSLESKYKAMLESLSADGIPVVRYGRHSQAQLDQIEKSFADFGLNILGPTRDHLIRCAEALFQSDKSVSDQLVAIAPLADPKQNLAQLYCQFNQELVSDTADALGDRNGAALNNQSIIIKVEADGRRALLAGDMQFVSPGISGLDELMPALRRTVNEAGPYDFIKLTHHSASNGLNQSLLDEWKFTRFFAHSGGSDDDTHPSLKTLRLLKDNQSRLKYARTDHNGLITFDFTEPKLMDISRGNFNDFTPNPKRDSSSGFLSEETTLPVPKSESLVAKPTTASAAVGPSEPVTTNAANTVEVITRVPHVTTKVTITIEVEPEKKNPSVTPLPPPRQPNDQQSAQRIQIGNGRILPELLIVTSSTKLARNIGQTEADQVLQSINQTPTFQLVDLPPAVETAEEAAAFTRPKLQNNQLKGVVLIGGYDVVPAYQLDVLDAKLRRTLIDQGRSQLDADDFIVWSDELYGDRDGDFIAELPISRIPDGRRADVLLAALQTPAFSPANRFAIRNIARPFADSVFPLLPRVQGDIQLSETFGPQQIQPGTPLGAVYYMLHGSDVDGTRFWGETAGRAEFEAISVENIPSVAPGTIVFTGCCWGALTATPPAVRAKPGALLRPRGPEASIAMSYLKAGAQAFVGCTGSHYSPTVAPYNFFGKPMHDAFWTQISLGKGPSEALFLAKQDYIKLLPHGQTDAFSQAVELKILRQFTCLGLGW